jgi:hypothetical protein
MGAQKSLGLMGGSRDLGLTVVGIYGCATCVVNVLELVNCILVKTVKPFKHQFPLL